MGQLARQHEAGAELLREGARLLTDIDAIANRVKRVATGWEPQFTIAVDSIINGATVMELCGAFFSLRPPTRVRLRAETLSGTLEALASGQADLALGVVIAASSTVSLHREPLGSVRFAFAVAPHHPLAHAPEPLSDEVIRQHRAVAVVFAEAAYFEMLKTGSPPAALAVDVLVVVDESDEVAGVVLPSN